MKGGGREGKGGEGRGREGKGGEGRGREGKGGEGRGRGRTVPVNSGRTEKHGYDEYCEGDECGED